MDRSKFFPKGGGRGKGGAAPFTTYSPIFFNNLKYLQMMSALEVPIPESSLLEDVWLYIGEAFQGVEGTGNMAPPNGDNPLKKHQQ